MLPLKQSEYWSVVMWTSLVFLLLSVCKFIFVLLFLLLAVDLSTGFVGAYFEYETPDIAVYINYFGISTMAGMVKVKTTNFMSSAFYGSVLGVFSEGVLSCGGVFKPTHLIAWLSVC